MRKGKKHPEVAPENQPLTDEEKAFVESYMRCLSRRQAILEASTKEYTDGGARNRGWVLYNRPHVKAEIERRFQEIRMETNGIWSRMSDFSRSSMEHFITMVEVVEDGGTRKAYPVVDLKKAEQAGMLHLLKRITPTKYGYSIEIVDPLEATKTLAKMEGILEPERDAAGDAKRNAFDDYMQEALKRLRDKARPK